MANAAAPPAEDAQAWGAAAAALAAAAWDGSGPVQRAGTHGVVRSFFDELFNHLDPYSRYEPPEDAAADHDRRSGEGGIGISLATRGPAILVQSVIAEGPAASAGIRPGERLLAINGRPVPGRDSANAAALLAGPEETPVTITLRSRDGRVRRIEMRRALVPPETVFAEHDADMLVLRITGFSRSTDRRVAHELTEAVAGPQHPRGIVFDLRANRGGLLRQAVAVTGTVLGTGPVATTAGRDPEADHAWEANGTDFSGGLPVVVLVDGRSASAAEIVAAALSDNGRAVVVGSTTLGKGLVQTIAPLPDGGELFVTWSRVLAPLGWPIQGLGVLPQVCTSLGQDALARQLASLEQGRQPMQRALALHAAARAPMPVAQMLDLRNACPAAVGSDRDLQAAHVLIDAPASYATALAPPPPLRRSAGRE
ncbi:MAG: PDZ domain-containing protein [Acidisphaera sp.]|nr:PDZ domain-containing protein [Acidisphaera sp.]